jgi:phosphatidylserine/phosphatidylglycerophosphate/cardiolipin synthase-like enzyme
VADRAEEEILRRVYEFAHRVPPELVDSVCSALERESHGFGIGPAALAIIPDGRSRGDLAELLRLWAASHAQAGWQSLTWSLRAASRADQAWRAENSLELVWTGPTPPCGSLRRTGQALLEVIDSATSELWLVSFAGYKLPEVRQALERAGDRRVVIRLIMESPEESEGKVSFSVVDGLGHGLADLATVYVWPLAKRAKDERGRHGSLHVKCALADDQSLFVSSANLTDFAVHLNMELGLLVKGGEVPPRVGEHLRWLIADGHLVAATVNRPAPINSRR